MSAQADEYLLTLARSLEGAGDTGRALAVLDLAASRTSGAAEALSLKGDLLRSRGDLRQAADVFDLIGQRFPDQVRARYLSALLRGARAPLPASRPAPWPSAFVRVEDFLSKPRHHELMELMTSPTSTFQPSTVGGMGLNGRQPRVAPEARTSLRLTETAQVEHWLRPLLGTSLLSMATQLGMAPFIASMIELKCAAYGDGSFFRVHSDNINHPTRRISFVYYFHREPKPYTGGALVLHDGDVNDPRRLFHEPVTRLDTLDNSIVFFPSGTHHEVTPVVCPSGRLEDARFAFSGHVHASDEDAAARHQPDQT